MGTSKKAKRLRVLRFAKEVAAGKSYKDAAIAVGYSAKTADVAGSNLAARPEAKAIMEAALDKAGASVEVTASVIAKGHRATKFIGESFKEVEDVPTQLKAADLALRARRMLGPETSNTTNVQVNFIDIIAEQARQRGFIDAESKPTP